MCRDASAWYADSLAVVLNRGSQVRFLPRARGEIVEPVRVSPISPCAITQSLICSVYLTVCTLIRPSLNTNVSMPSSTFAFPESAFHSNSKMSSS